MSRLVPNTSINPSYLSLSGKYNSSAELISRSAPDEPSAAMLADFHERAVHARRHLTIAPLNLRYCSGVIVGISTGVGVIAVYTKDDKIYWISKNLILARWWPPELFDKLFMRALAPEFEIGSSWQFEMNNDGCFEATCTHSLLLSKRMSQDAEAFVYRYPPIKRTTLPKRGDTGDEGAMLQLRPKFKDPDEFSI